MSTDFCVVVPCYFLCALSCQLTHARTSGLNPEQGRNDSDNDNDTDNTLDNGSQQAGHHRLPRHWHRAVADPAAPAPAAPAPADPEGDYLVVCHYDSIMLIM